MRDYSTAYTLFLAAFSNFENSGNAQKVDCIKQCVVSKMLSQDEINPFENPAMSGYRSQESVVAWCVAIIPRWGNSLCRTVTASVAALCWAGMK